MIQKDKQDRQKLQFLSTLLFIFFFNIYFSGSLFLFSSSSRRGLDAVAGRAAVDVIGEKRLAAPQSLLARGRKKTAEQRECACKKRKKRLKVIITGTRVKKEREREVKKRKKKKRAKCACC